MLECVYWILKNLTYEFHYHYIKNKYESKSRLLFTQTDTSMYQIKTEDIYKDFNKIKMKQVVYLSKNLLD